MSSHLFSPITIGGITLSNRIAVSPMCQYSAADGSATDWHLQHLGSLALSGAGLLIVEATAVEAEGRITPSCLGLYSDANEAALERVVATCRRWGEARLGIQLAHAGRKASSQVPWLGGKPLTATEGAWQRAAASPIPFADGYPSPEPLDDAGLARVRDAFAASARRADRLGFDLVELHGAHGYLLHSFHSPIANSRTDRYGGSAERRMRWPLEVAAAVRAVWPPTRRSACASPGPTGPKTGSPPATPSSSRASSNGSASITSACRAAASARRRASRSGRATRCRSPPRSRPAAASRCRRWA
jgi:2,4-dienoyl-CoA reductase-like NADH-dependent reductase (Old Yellow Enzyme family)